MVVYGPDEDVSAERFASDPGGEQIFALIVITVIDEDLSNVFHFISAERRAVVKFAWKREEMIGYC